MNRFTLKDIAKSRAADINKHLISVVKKSLTTAKPNVSGSGFSAFRSPQNLKYALHRARQRK